VADRQLALDLHPGDEEEDRQQAVGDPVGERQVELQPAGPERRARLPERVIARLREVRPQQRGGGGREQQLAAVGLFPQEVADRFADRWGFGAGDYA
jgi:hypothetical protein